MSRQMPIRSNLASARHQAELAHHATSEATPVIDMNLLSLVEIAAMNAPLAWEDPPAWLTRFLRTDLEHHGEWEATAKALSQNGSHVASAARDLAVHTNTVYYRLSAVRDTCDIDLRDPSTLADLLVACASRDFGRLTPPL